MNEPHLKNPSMKVLIVTDAWHPQINGVVRTYEHLDEQLTALGHDLKIVGPRDFPWRLPLPGYAEIEVALMPYGRLGRIIKDFKPDHIHIATEGTLGWAARKFCMRHDFFFSTAYHTHFPDYMAKRLGRIGRVFPWLYDFVHRHAKTMIRCFHAPSKIMMVATKSLEETLRAWGFENKMHHLTRGVDLDLFYPGAKTLFKDLNGPVALYVGRIAVEKNIEDFVTMEWHGSKVLVGDGPCKAALEKKHPDILFAGVQEKEALAAYYRSADVFVFPSRTDTFGMVLIEALASGLPVAGYNVTGPKDIITEAYLGALDEVDLGKAAQGALLVEAADRRAAHVKSLYSWKKAGEQFEEALRDSA